MSVTIGFHKMEQIEIQDTEWAHDWKIIVEIFSSIDQLKSLFKSLDVSYLREIQQKVLILNLEKYVWTLQNHIIEKYSKA
jgi:hypothetical protein